MRSPVHVAFYLSFFPHLIAGPILRFNDIAAPLARPVVMLPEFDQGVARFINGLGRTTLIANPLGHVADQIFALPPGQLAAPAAWLGILAYALQIYFDFSGYSDMAIGLGHLFGFTLPENFQGVFQVVVKTNSGNTLYEHGATANNTIADDTTLTVTLIASPVRASVSGVSESGVPLMSIWTGCRLFENCQVEIDC